MSDAAQIELQVGGAVAIDSPVYIVRRSDHELLRLLQEGEYCNVLCPRQMGKTSAIFRVRAQLRGEGCRTALIDVGGRLGTPPEADEWYRGLLSELNAQFKLDRDVNAWWAASPEPTANLKLLAFLRQEILARSPHRFVVFLDEIDHTLNLPYTDDFFLAIRSLYNDRAAEPDLRRLAFCLVGVFTPNELVKQQRTTTYNVGRTLELQDFNLARDDLSPLAQILSEDSTRGNALLAAVLRWTGGQPYLTASACKKVAAARIDSPDAVDLLIEEAFLAQEKPLEHSDGIHFESITRFLDQRVIARIETLQLYRHILRGDKERESPTPTVLALKLSGLVRTDRNAWLVIRNEIYRRRFDADWAMIEISLEGRPGGAHAVTVDQSAAIRTEAPLQRKPIAEDVQKESSLGPDKTRSGITRLFISNTALDDSFVRELQQALGDHGEEVWIDSRQLRGGDPLWQEIENAIDDAAAYAVLVTPASLQSKWVGKELRHALAVQKQRGKDRFPVIPLSLDGTKLGVVGEFFDTEPMYVPVSSEAGGSDMAVSAILVALGKRVAADAPLAPQPSAQRIEELVLELTDLRFQKKKGLRSASARARLVYQPATQGQPEVASTQSWRFVAPLGPIEAEELRWYLEKFAVWPSEIFRNRARRVEESLVEWGRLLYKSALPVEHTSNVLKAWAQIKEDSGRRFSVHVDAALEADAPAAERVTARKAAAVLLGLPWELLHDGDTFLFQGARPTRVRRRLPNARALTVPVMSTPIRILLVTARPEDEACGYIDHRASALPLVEAMEELGGLVRIHVLSPPTLPALREELDRARLVRQQYHVVHFDGYGIYDRRAGLGGLCFEDPQDIDKLDQRRHVTVTTDDLGPLLRDHRIPLIFLEAWQTATAEPASESVASELLNIGVASVVAMSHGVLVETARRFVEAFYDALARGARVGDAMLEGQRRLKDDTFRGRVFGVGELRLEDWFVPVLFQEKEDPQLFRTTPGAITQATTREAHAARMGELPPTPETGFIGRSRELLALQRLLRHENYAVIHGQGGEGKTALAAELARWMVRSHQIRRAAFVSVETHSNHLAVLDAIGRQLVGNDYSAATFNDMENAILPVERALIEQSTLIVIDSMESILLPPYVETSEVLSEEAQRELMAVLALCARLQKTGETRLVFTSREAMVAPFDAKRRGRELHRLDSEDAVKLVERALNAETENGAGLDAARESIEALVDAVHGHARTLALLAPSLRSQGVDATRESLVELMNAMEKKFPGSREHSLFASVELSLRRMSLASREKVRALGVFFGAIDLDVLRAMMEWEEVDVIPLARELIETGLATPGRFNHLTLNPALCPYLRSQMDAKEYQTLMVRWGDAMREYVSFLVEQQNQNAEMAATLTVLELPNLFALLDQTQRVGDVETTIDLATSLFTLLRNAGKPRLLERVTQVRDAAAAALDETWNHARFDAQRIRIEQQLASGRLHDAVDAAQELFRRSRAGGEESYPDADYDLAVSVFLLARVSEAMGNSEQALPLLDAAQERFENIAQRRDDKAAERMASACLLERGHSFRNLGRLDEAAAAYEESIRRDETHRDERGVAVGKGQLGIVRYHQRRYNEALVAFEQARERFTLMEEPATVAVFWHQTGMVYQAADQPEAAEDAYRKSLAIKVRLGNVAGQASTLGQLGILYDDGLGRPEEAAALLRQAVDKYVEIRDAANEGRARTNLAGTLMKLRRLDEARQEIRRAIQCDSQFGYATQPWKTWAILAEIESADGNLAAATEAKRKATASYLAYRRDGGENHNPTGPISVAVTERLLQGDQVAAGSLLEKQATRFATTDFGGFIQALQAIVAGSRDRILADTAELDYMMAAEILFLLETLQKEGK